MAMATVTNIGTGLATNATNAIIGVLFQQLKDVQDLGENVQLLQNELARMDAFLRHIHTQFEAQQKKLPEMVEICLDQRMKGALEDAKALIGRADRQRERCLGCCLVSCSKIPAEIRGWKTRFNELFRELESALLITANTQQIVQSAQHQAEVLRQPLPESGFVGSGIAESEQKVLTWLKEPHHQARVIGVYGMAGVGKTSLLYLIHNQCKKMVSSNFDHVIWFTVTKNYNPESLQDCIAESLNLDVKGISSIEMRKMKLYESLESKRCVLILDDLWSSVDLNQVGVNFGHDNSSRVLISSRSREVVEIMAGNAGYFMKIQPLSIEEGWELFRRRAFTNGAAGDKNVEGIAEKVALECNGLPLAINTVAAALAGKKTASEWNSALEFMKSVDPSFPTTHKTIDKDLYQPLRLSYNDLKDDLKMCFLYCAVFPEDARINVETLVEMWTAESLVPQKGRTYFMDVGQAYIDALVNRCLIEYVDVEKKKIKVHDVLRDMAIYIGQEDKEKWLFLAGQHLQDFPSEEETKGCKRISVFDNGISDLPADLKSAPTVVSLVLAQNEDLKEIPESFLVNFKSLKVLDLSHTSIQTLPTSVGQLGQLVFLNLSYCEELKDLPDDICNLSHLQFLNLDECYNLKSLPARIGALKNLKHLQFSSFLGKGVEVISHQISQLTSLNKLVLPRMSNPMSVEHLTNLSSLIKLDVRVKPKMKGGSMSSWLEMRELTLWFCREGEDGDDAAVDFVPRIMESMKKLQTLHLSFYQGVSLADCIYQFQNLKNLYLEGCSALKELPVMEMGSDAASGGYPMLERLHLWSLDSLESIVRDEGTMLKLQSVWISSCPVLKTLGMKELPILKELRISYCDGLESIVCGYPMLETLELRHLERLESIVCGYPMLETLELRHLERLESIVWDERFTMSKLQSVCIQNCPVLKTLGMKELPNLKELWISDCDGLESIVCGYPMLERLSLSYLKSLESIAWHERFAMLKLQSVWIYELPMLKTLWMDKLPNLKNLKISECSKLKELFMGNDGSQMLETLHFEELNNLESISPPCSMWNERTMPKLRYLALRGCPFSRGLSDEKLLALAGRTVR